MSARLRVSFAAAIVIGLAAVQGTGRPALAEILPESGEFEGVYHRDRWGVGRFSYFLVAPELHEQLSKVENRRIRLDVVAADQPANPGEAIIRKIGEVTVLEPSPLDVELAAVTRPMANDKARNELELAFRLINRTQDDIEISLHDVFAGVRFGVKVADPDIPSLFFPDYTSGQLGTTVDGLQWSNNHLTVAIGSFEQGHHLLIHPGESFPLIARVKAEVGPHEISIRGRPLRGDDRLPEFDKRFVVHIARQEGVDTDRAPSKLNLQDVKWTPAKNTWQKPVHRLSFTLVPPHDGKRSIVSCSQNDKTLAGTLATVLESGARAPIDVDPRYDCSNFGYRWQLAAIPAEGISTHLDIGLGRKTAFAKKPQKVRLELLTEQGLESFDLEMPPYVAPND